MGFWDDTSLEALSAAQWEALCDGCGRCCLVKLEDEESGELCYTAIACGELDLESCRCRHYAERRARVAECIALTAATLHDYPWLPSTCAYRLHAEGKPLPAWHPLLSGCSESVHAAGISVRNFAVSERDVDDDLDIGEFLLEHHP